MERAEHADTRLALCSTTSICCLSTDSRIVKSMIHGVDSDPLQGSAVATSTGIKGYHDRYRRMRSICEAEYINKDETQQPVFRQYHMHLLWSCVVLAC